MEVMVIFLFFVAECVCQSLVSTFLALQPNWLQTFAQKAEEALSRQKESQSNSSLPVRTVPALHPRSHPGQRSSTPPATSPTHHHLYVLGLA